MIIKKHAYALIPLIWLMLNSCAATRIIDKPIIFDTQREELTKEYLEVRYGLAGDSITIKPNMIVLHWTAIPTFEGSFDAFNDPLIPSWRSLVENASTLNVSSHFLVSRDGKIYRLMPETVMGRHVIGLNHCAIGIENVGGTADAPLTAEQLEANIWLVNYLKDKYDIEYLIGHYEYTKFEGHELWLEKDDGYRTEKEDPGAEFMQQVRQATKKLNFKPLPQKQ
ncbi:N-acetylmuramoyl-L-alanine amidase [Muriicola soli]|uniref:N-acetylmuramoyl-L-alanine amidase n=1 Tax=Muriicola soli TaxID=2507538 RepID=A0A411E964_9FLAO|nr:peptidoglycan recognition family protein [Muriicola soli]QBA64178.1 N-acetylmuramoyl-L-alanine amidase [Muriicola soli]